MGLAVTIKHLHTFLAFPSNIAINHRTCGAGLKTATRFLAGYGGRYVHMRLRMNRETILRRVAFKCVDCARQLFHHEAFTPYAEDFKYNNYWIYCYNNSIDMAVLDWCHLFGNAEDELHWRNVISNVEDFRNDLLTFLDISFEDWEQYWNTVKDYRDKDVAHIEVRPVTNVPTMKLGITAVGFYYNSIISELRGFNDKYQVYPDDFFKYMQRYSEKAELFVESHIKENLVFMLWAYKHNTALKAVRFAHWTSASLALLAAP